MFTVTGRNVLYGPEPIYVTACGARALIVPVYTVNVFILYLTIRKFTPYDYNTHTPCDYNTQLGLTDRVRIHVL